MLLRKLVALELIKIQLHWIIQGLSNLVVAWLKFCGRGITAKETLCLEVLSLASILPDPQVTNKLSTETGREEKKPARFEATTS